MLAYVFPGQGAQFRGMGETLFDEFPELTAKADKILRYSIKELCISDPHRQLNKTQFTQPALYIVNVLSYLQKIRQTGKKPDYVAGHSLGEYNALFAAEALDFETGLRLVQKRGELMSQATNGRMAAIIGLTKEKVSQVIADNKLNNIDIANHNSALQITIAGLRDQIEAAQPVFEKAGASMYILLNVSGAFHSRYMADAGKIYAQYLNSFEFAPPLIPVISNVYARPYRAEDLKRNLTQQITQTVNWVDSIRYLMGRGEVEIVEVGPGKTLTKLTKIICEEAEPLFVPDEENR